MDLFLEDQRIPILYLAKYREYNIPLLYKNKVTALQGIMYCPWCSKKLPEQLRDKWFEILEKEYKLDDSRREEQENIIIKITLLCAILCVRILGAYQEKNSPEE